MTIQEAIEEVHKQEIVWFKADKIPNQELCMNNQILNFKIASHKGD